MKTVTYDKSSAPHDGDGRDATLSQYLQDFLRRLRLPNPQIGCHKNNGPC